MKKLFSLPRKIRRGFRDFAANVSGLSAVEFSLLAPFLTIGAISTVDAGMMAYEKMMISQSLRAGAQSAIAAKTESVVRTIIESTAGENFTVAVGAPVGDELGVSVSQYCICPDAPGVQIDCSTTCSGAASAERFYDLSASKSFAGVILSGFTISGQMSVTAQ